MKLILSYMKKYRWTIVLALVLKLAATMLELLLPYVLEYTIDVAAPAKDLPLVIVCGVVMIVLAVLTCLLNIRSNRTAIRNSSRTAYDIRRDLFFSSLHLSGRQTDEVGLASLISRMTTDSYNVQTFAQILQTMGIRAPITVIGGIIVTVSMDVGLASILLVILPIMLVVIISVSLRGIPLFDRVQQRIDAIVRIMRENITGIRVVKALSKEEYERQRYHEANEQMNRADRKAGIVMSLPGPLMSAALNIGLTFVILIGARRVNNGQTQPGVILAFLTYFNMILFSIMAINRVFMMASRANASAARIGAVISQSPEPVPLPEEQLAKTASSDLIVFDHVTFNYNAVNSNAGSKEDEPQPALTDISFSIPKGGSLGIIGATGSGKTTIINLLMRFYDATEGNVFIGGKDVRGYDVKELRQKFGTVFQNDVIFADTLESNIRFGRSLSSEQVRSAGVDALADSFISAYSDGYRHTAAIKGANLSGGQRQRVLIARALAALPEILILDDSSSALDYRTDAELRHAIREHHSESTTVIIAQRVSSIMGLDQILMLDEGRIAGLGTHSQLMESCPQYRSVYETQMGEEV